VRTRPIRILSAALMGLLWLTSFGASASLAHTVYQGWFDMWTSEGKCIKQKSSIWEDGQQLVVLSEVWAKKNVNTPWGTIHCDQNWVRPIGTLRTRFILHKSGAGVCRWGDWRYNGSQTYLVQRIAAFRRPCGSGWYGNQTGGQTHWNGAWRPADHLFSGWHWGA